MFMWRNLDAVRNNELASFQVECFIGSLDGQVQPIFSKRDFTKSYDFITTGINVEAQCYLTLFENANPHISIISLYDKSTSDVQRQDWAEATRRSSNSSSLEMN